MRRDNKNVMGERESPVKHDAGQLSLDEKTMKGAWKELFERIFNIEFLWNTEDLPD